MSETRQRTAVITARLTPEEHAAVRTAAGMCGLSVSAYVAEVVLADVELLATAVDRRGATA